MTGVISSWQVCDGTMRSVVKGREMTKVCQREDGEEKWGGRRKSGRTKRKGSPWADQKGDLLAEGVYNIGNLGGSARQRKEGNMELQDLGEGSVCRCWSAQRNEKILEPLNNRGNTGEGNGDVALFWMQ